MMLTADGHMFRRKDFDDFLLVYFCNISISGTDLGDTNSVVRKVL